MRTIHHLALAFVLACGCAHSSSPRHAPLGVGVTDRAPPAPLDPTWEERPGEVRVHSRWAWVDQQWVWQEGWYEPARAFMDWCNGYWDRRNKHYEWVPGTWKRARDGQVFEPGHWGERHGTYVWIQDRWEPDQPGMTYLPGTWTIDGDDKTWTEGRWETTSVATE